ncbi:MAG: hypothetical protein ACRDRW_00710, partial [Pseudonocardiaceae bacterium]
SRRRDNPFHEVKLVTDALDVVRRQVWRSARKLRDQGIAKRSVYWQLTSKLTVSTSATPTIKQYS